MLAMRKLAWQLQAALLSQLTRRTCIKLRPVFAAVILQLHDAAQRTAMSTPQTFMKQEPSTTPPSSFAEHPLTPPPTEEKRFFQVPRVLRLFTDIRAGKHIYQGPWIEFKLAEGEYNEIERQLRQNEALSGFTKDKIR